MELENSQNNSFKVSNSQTRKSMRNVGIRISYFQIQDYALWEVIENGNSWVPIPVTAPESGPSTALKMTVLEEPKQARENLDAQLLRDWWSDDEEEIIVLLLINILVPKTVLMRTAFKTVIMAKPRTCPGNIAQPFQISKRFDGVMFTFWWRTRWRKITGKGNYKTDKLDFEDVNFVQGVEGLFLMLLQYYKNVSVIQHISQQDQDWMKGPIPTTEDTQGRSALIGESSPSYEVSTYIHAFLPVLTSRRTKESFLKLLSDSCLKLMKDKFQMSSMGELTFFLGFAHVNKGKKGIFIIKINVHEIPEEVQHTDEKCKKQTVVATSTTEAEYVAAANCCGQSIMAEPQSPDHVFDFPADDPVLNLEDDLVLDIVEGPEEDEDMEVEEDIPHVAASHVGSPPISPPPLSESSSGSGSTAPVSADRTVSANITIFNLYDLFMFW
ncbi:hypothetical protein Tco_0652667 [Tanacetum coccineum]|uniref:Uncharacterized protein n=1 Tax=Tanacetum coccineum TaxID=301880 RepID=A0ABQ4WY67_9ASTR